MPCSEARPRSEVEALVHGGTTRYSRRMDINDRHFTPRSVIAAEFTGAPPVDLARLRADLDAYAPQRLLDEDASHV